MKYILERIFNKKYIAESSFEVQELYSYNDSTDSTSFQIDKLPLIPETKKKRIILIFTLSIAVVAALLLIKPLKKEYYAEVSTMDVLKNEDAYAARTVSDIKSLQNALEHFYNDNKSYPNTNSNWYGIECGFGEARADWIPGLAPKYINKLPSDPRKIRTPTEQYMYKSDGKDFKLMAHSPVGMSTLLNKYPKLADTRRPSWAISVCTEEAKSW